LIDILDKPNKHAYTYPKVKRIKKVTHDRLDEALKASPGAHKLTLLWHGTKYGAVTEILHTGFRLPTHDNSMFGRGLYFASDSSKSWQYSHKHGSNVILLCDVALGDRLVINDVDKDITYNNLLAQNKQSVWAKANTCVIYDEFVVYSCEQAVVRYIIEFERDKNDEERRQNLPECPDPQCYDVAPEHTNAFYHPHPIKSS